MIKIAICICTKRRQDGLKELLESIGRMKIPEGINIRIIVVENDNKNYSENIVKKFSEIYDLTVNYFLETLLGLVYARNRSVKEAGICDFCCFVDDDQIVDPDWLIELVKCQKEFNADGVWGINPPKFKIKVPAYIAKFYHPKVFQYGEIVDTAATNCLLLRKSYLAKMDGPFDKRLNFTGGEDSYLTYQIAKSGGIIRTNPNAVAYEIIPESRATISSILKKKFRISNAGIYVKFMRNSNFSWQKESWRLTLRLCYGILIAAPYYVFSNADKLKGLIKIADGIGGLMFLFGIKSQFYK